ncbi:Glycine/D-amino acid oxidase [Shimia gijangensis]|uniref:Glycine/D-amino acid oxidase n=1 Tax=Shimia gijangensis TaxID=1470563 RepID=A0A1M6QKQ3_9RHOB|nr:FAD-dependent oxidoreductase [Shimia gijangensis]SHK20832.1 Glycine/D-amino acid oxidase [Shimia gijangensis]
MTRICDPFAYSEEPVETCFWNETASAAPRAALSRDIAADVAVIGGGYTGLSAALHLAEAGRSVVLLEEKQPGWGASGRNGGFCCRGGSKMSGAKMRRRFGDVGYRDYQLTERDAVDLVADLISRHGIQADIHSNGETSLAHRPKDLRGLEDEAREVKKLFGVDADVFGQDGLAERGMNGAFYGGITTPIGFGLNPKKYVLQLADVVENAGARIFGDTAVTCIEGEDGAFVLHTPQGKVRAGKVVMATNGYSSENIPNWMRGRYFPAQSSVIVTRPLSDKDLEAQGWTSDQMAYDTRNLLHYFRLMPDRRFLFGMRGGLATSRRVHHAIKGSIRKDFETMFPGWANVETPWYWSGFVCYAPDMTPFVGEIPGSAGIFASYAYHGNGVALGSYSGALLAEQIAGKSTLRQPDVLTTPPRRTPGGSYRRLAMYPAYLGYRVLDL